MYAASDGAQWPSTAGETVLLHDLVVAPGAQGDYDSAIIYLYLGSFGILYLSLLKPSEFVHNSYQVFSNTYRTHIPTFHATQRRRSVWRNPLLSSKPFIIEKRTNLPRTASSMTRPSEQCKSNTAKSETIRVGSKTSGPSLPPSLA